MCYLIMLVFPALKLASYTTASYTDDDDDGTGMQSLCDCICIKFLYKHKLCFFFLSLVYNMYICPSCCCPNFFLPLLLLYQYHSSYLSLNSMYLKTDIVSFTFEP